MSIEALKLTLEALQDYVDEYGPWSDDSGAQYVLRVGKEALAQPEQEPEFIKHEVESAEDWSEWVCPNPHKYLMKCCDCGLVHEAQFGVVRYKSEDEREACDFVDDPNLQAVFRMRRSEQWSPEDTAHRAGGMPMAQPEQREPTKQEHNILMGALKRSGKVVAQPKQEQGEPVAVVTGVYGGRFIVEPTNSTMVLPVNMALYAHPQPRKPLTHAQMKKIWYAMQNIMGWYSFQEIARAIEAAHNIKE